MQICNDMKRFMRFFIGHSTACYAKLRADILACHEGTVKIA